MYTQNLLYESGRLAKERQNDIPSVSDSLGAPRTSRLTSSTTLPSPWNVKFHQADVNAAISYHLGLDQCIDCSNMEVKVR